MARYISIISSGKGIGKTTVALNLGLALHKIKQKVLVFDADFSKPNLIEHLDIDALPITLEDVFNGNNHVFDSIYRHASGLKIIPSLALNDYSKLSYHLQDLAADYDFVIMDTPQDILDLTEVLKNSNEAIIVHSPEYSSKIVIDAIDLLRNHRITNLGIILNKSTQESVDSIYDAPVLEKLPDDIHIRKSFELKHPVLHSYPSSVASKKFMHLAKRLVI